MVIVVFEGSEGVGSGCVKKEVGRAMSTTPRSEMREAYCADLEKGSRRKR